MIRLNCPYSFRKYKDSLYNSSFLCDIVLSSTNRFNQSWAKTLLTGRDTTCLIRLKYKTPKKRENNIWYGSLRAIVVVMYSNKIILKSILTKTALKPLNLTYSPEPDNLCDQRLVTYGTLCLTAPWSYQLNGNRLRSVTISCQSCCHSNVLNENADFALHWCSSQSITVLCMARGEGGMG